MGTIGADCSWAARVTTPGPPPQPHATWLDEVGAGSIEIPAFLGWGVRAVPRFPRLWSFGAH